MADALTVREQQALRETVRSALLRLADAERLYQTDASFHLHVDVFVAGLPGAVGGLAEQARSDSVRRDMVTDLIRISGTGIDVAVQLTNEVWQDSAVPPPLPGAAQVTAPGPCVECETQGVNCRAHGGR